MICKVCNKEIKEYYLNDVLGIKKHTICYKCFSELPLIYEFGKIQEYKCLSLYAYKDKIKELIYQFKGLKDIELKDIFLLQCKKRRNHHIQNFCPRTCSVQRLRGTGALSGGSGSIRQKQPQHSICR